MKVKPQKIKIREELNLKQGIKSSLPNMNKLISSLYTLYLISDKSVINYSDEYIIGGQTKIKLNDIYEKELLLFFKEQIISSNIKKIKFLDLFNSTPIFKSQLESLQVAIELFWKLGEISFNNDLSSSSERTGGNRFKKKLFFSTNIDILDSVLSNEKSELSEQTKNLLFNYLVGTKLTVSDVEKKLIKLLTIFSEEAQYKIRHPEGEIYFQQEGIYTEIINNNTVISKDSHEPVGPFRILKSAIKDNLNFYIKDTKDGFILKDNISDKEMENYLVRVNTFLNLNPQRTKIEIIQVEETETYTEIKDNDYNLIFFGPPGTGKSYNADALTQGHITEKVTFHPEFDYNSFVGGYKPISDGEDIKYKFVPQIFTDIYVKAWKNPHQTHFLQIEEINRGNVSAIFGDLFQLLDRDEKGFSKYSVTPEAELRKYLEKELTEEGKNGIEEGKMRLPNNFRIVATMNTSDQSLFPIDSAFKRRWKWKFVKIDYELKESNFIIELDNSKQYKWLEFIKAINYQIYKITESPDKQIGNFFVDAQYSNNKINEETLLNKVFFYLWNDIFKDENETIFLDRKDEKIYFEKLFEYEGNERSDIISYIIENLGIAPIETIEDEK